MKTKRSDPLPDEFYVLLSENGKNQPNAQFIEHPDAEIPFLMMPNENEIVNQGKEFSSEEFLKKVNDEIYQQRFWYLLFGVMIGLILANLISFSIKVYGRRVKNLRKKATRKLDDDEFPDFYWFPYGNIKPFFQ